MDKVIIIDDSEFDRAMICKAIALKRSDVTFMELSNGENAANIIASENPRFAILDIRMPGLDGFAVLESIRQHPIASKVPILMISGSEQPEDKLLAAEGGADGYYIKPPTAAAYFSLGKSLYDRYLCCSSTDAPLGNTL